MREVKVVRYDEVEFDYCVCDEIYGDGCDRSVDDRYLDVEFLNIIFKDRLEWEESVEKKEVINNMIDSISKLDDDVLVEF